MQTSAGMKQPVGLLGSGSWATAMAKILTQNGHPIVWYVRKEEDRIYMAEFHHNPRYLADVAFNPDDITIVDTAREVLKACDLVFLIIPSAFVKNELQGLTAAEFKGKQVVTGIKGILPEGNVIITDYLYSQYQLPAEDMAILAGPCHAEEIALEKKSYLTIGSAGADMARQVAAMLQNRYVNTTTSQDLFGLEYAAIIKNIIAIACGMAHGLGYGDNFQAVLVSNAMVEIWHFLNIMAPSPGRNIALSGYAGDVLVTCYSQFSRNRTFGTMIGRGYSVQSAQMEMNMVAEGYYATGCLARILADNQIEMPVCQMVNRILYQKAPARLEFARLEKLLK